MIFFFLYVIIIVMIMITFKNQPLARTLTLGCQYLFSMRAIRS